MSSIHELLEWGKHALKSQTVPLLEAQVLLAHVLACDRAYLYAWPEKEVTPEKIKAFCVLIERRQNNEPIAYLVGYKEFWSLSFDVTQDTLIPRADTELLIQVVLNHLPKQKQHVIDVGTGSGVIACTLAHCCPNWQLVGLDISDGAVLIARQNAQKLNLQNVTFIQSDWFQALPLRPYDAIIGNPPYIRAGDIHLVHGDLPYEPAIALTPGPTGLEAFHSILSTCDPYLKTKGLIAFEHGYDQGEAVRDLFAQYGFVAIQTFQDLAGKERVTIAKKGVGAMAIALK